MLTSLKSKIILLITVIMGITAAVIMLSTHRDVANAILNAEKSSAQNVLRLVEATIQAGYNRVIVDKIEILERLKKELKNTAAISISAFAQLDALYANGKLSRQESQNSAMQQLRSISTDAGETFIFDLDGIIKAHSDPGLERVSIAPLRDLKGRNILEIMRADRLQDDGDFAVFSWPREGENKPRSKMGYFIPIPNWRWTLATSIDFDSIEQETQSKMENIITGLENTFAKIKIANSGYIFLFDGDQNMLIAPSGAPVAEPQNSDSISTDELLAKLRLSIQHNNGTLRYLDPYSPVQAPVEAYTSYFKAFDWYVVLVVPVNEIQAPAEALLTRQSLLITFIFIGGLLAAYFLVARISRPLDLLAAYAKELPKNDFTADSPRSSNINELPLRNKDEVGRLAQAFAFMDTELRKNISKSIKAALDKDAATRANEAKSKFLAHISHELRTPLNGILGFTQILQREGQLTPKQLEGLATIRHCGDHLLNLIEEILDLAKIEAGKMELKPRVFSLQQLLQPIIELFKVRAQQKGLSFRVSLPSPMPAWVYGDDLKLRQVLINLLSNAIKFTPSGLVALRVSRFKDRILFQVEDTGIGIAKEKLDFVFQPFGLIREARSTTEGTGLGLTISQQLVELMGGSLAVQSSISEGSAFWFDLSLPQSSAPPPKQSRQGNILSVKDRTPSVMIVDDNISNRAFLKSLLEPLGFQCQEAIDGADCLERVKKAPPEIILLDQIMPNLSGLETTLRLREMPDLAQTIIIAISASASEASKKGLLEAGCNGFLAKPLQIGELLETLRSLARLDWLYAEPIEISALDHKEAAIPSETPEQASWQEVPESILDHLWEAARTGHHSGVMEQVDKLEAQGSQYAQIVSELRSLTNQFQFHKICAMVEPLITVKS